MNRRNSFVLILIIICFSIIALLLFKSSRQVYKNKNPLPLNQAPRPTSNIPKETIIKLTDSGFVPQSVIIKKNESIRWINTGMKTGTVNSDDHPTHKLYAELNLGMLKKDQYLVHTFTKTGTYTYHDHYNPSRTGKIVVE